MKDIIAKHPMSWSQLSSWEYDPQQWYLRYVLRQKQESNDAMLLGKKIGEQIANDPTFMPEIPRLSIFEQPLEAKLGKVPLVGYADSYEPYQSLYEYKTGVREWTQKRADTHGQIDMYLLMLYLSDFVPPQSIGCKLVWLPTRRDENNILNITGEIKVFDTERSMEQVLHFAKYIQDTIKKMDLYIRTFGSKI